MNEQVNGMVKDSDKLVVSKHPVLGRHKLDGKRGVTSLVVSEHPMLAVSQVRRHKLNGKRGVTQTISKNS